jgi:tetratricopeptide (TPR) repeat protein
MFAAMCLVNRAATEKVISTQPPWYFLTPHSYKKFDQIIGVSFGYRSLLADFKYISFLQYYGNIGNAKVAFKDLLGYIDDMTDADPHYTFAYTYGSAILAFNLKRYDESIYIIQKGIKFNPQFWKLRFYMGAIIYSRKGEIKKYVGVLEEALKFDDHPSMIESLLGNIYELYKTPDEAAAFWVWVYKHTKDRDVRKHAYDRLLLMLREHKISDPGIFVNL